MSAAWRWAEPADLPAIAMITVASWRATYAGVVSGEFLAGFTTAGQERRHAGLLAAPGVRYRLALRDEEVVGFASGGPSRFPGYAAAHEVYGLYLMPTHQRQGLGSALFRQLCRALDPTASQGLLVLALADNPHRVFYERQGGQCRPAAALTLGAAHYVQYAYLWPAESSGPVPRP